MIKNGFTLIEIILVVSITILIAATTIPLSSNFLAQNQLDIKSADIASYLRIAQISALSSKDNSDWGVYTDDSKAVLFKGSSFTARDESYDLVTKIPRSLGVTDSETVYHKFSGMIDQPSTITVTGSTNQQKIISVNTYGIVNVD
jgi:type II secretory pathway pseudopilin PulG